VLLAVRGDEIVATIAAFERDYLMSGRRRTFLETLDWYCLPELRGSGIGVRVLQTLMQSGTPIMAVGGTADTLALLPRLGWKQVAEASCHRLPLGGRSSGESLRRRAGIPSAAGGMIFSWLARPWFRPRVRQRSAGGKVQSVPVVPDDLLSLYEGDTGYAVLPLPHPARLRWLTAGSFPMGPFVILLFTVGEALRGWTMFRVHGPEIRREVSLVEVYAPRPDAALYTWMISESLVRAASFNPEAINSRTTCPLVRRALSRNRFLRAGDAPIHVWPGDLEGVADSVHMVENVSDLPLIPYPSPVSNGTLDKDNPSS
jgi:hypothetical protein